LNFIKALNPKPFIWAVDTGDEEKKSLLPFDQYMAIGAYFFEDFFGKRERIPFCIFYGGH